MGALVRFAILEIGRVQFGGAGVVIIQAQVPQRFEIGKVTGIFLDRPLPFWLPGEHLWRQSANRIGQAFRREPKPFQNFRSGRCPKAKLKFAIEPASRCHSGRP